MADRTWKAAVLTASLSALGQAKAPAVFANADNSVRVEYDLGAGTADFFWGGAKVIARGAASVKLGSAHVKSADYSQRTFTAVDIQDALGRGKRFTVSSTGAGLAAMKQVFFLYDNQAFLLTEVAVEGNALSSNWMSPLLAETAGGVDIGGGQDLRALEVPWDNDRFVRYNAGPLNRAATSYEVSAFYDNASRRGLITGSVTHDLWKTGVDFSGAGGKLNRLAVYGGASDTATRDLNPHGSVRGSVLASPRVFVGLFQDWRDGLEVFADANAAIEPPLPWSGGRVFAWNSWGEIQSALNEQKALAVSDFFKNSLQNNNFHDGKGVATINLDAGAGNLGDAGLRRFTAHCKANGQKAGTYGAPFFTRSVGPELLLDPNGNPILTPDQNAYSRDPTHPNTRNVLRNFVNNSVAQGFEYIKIDFVTYGQRENRNGSWYDPAIMTGTQAYRQGLRYLDSLAAGRLHINLSISALFPYAQANSRRVSCDAFGNTGSTHYMLNSASYGWWMGGRIYAYNDPDHLVLAQWTENEARSRYTSGVVGGGGFMMLGDDFSNTARQDRAQRLATLAAVNDVARIGKPFRPVEGNTGTQPTDALELHHAGYLYVAIFNFTNAQAVKTVPLARLGVSAPSVTFDELWTGTKTTANGTLSASLGAYDARLFKSSQAVVPVQPPKKMAWNDRIQPPGRAFNALGRAIPASPGLERWGGAAAAKVLLR